MLFNGDEIITWMGRYLWVFFRIGAALAVMPVIGSRTVPVRIRLILALALTLIVAPLIPSAPAIEPLSPASLLVTAQQILIGVIMGFVLLLVFSAVVHAGQLIAMQLGLGFASMVDPQNGVTVPVVSQFYVIFITLVYLSFNGHLFLIKAVVESFHNLPISPIGFKQAALWELAASGGQMFSGSLQIALPVLAAILLVNITYGVVSRAAPQLNIFVIGFPSTLLLGFIAIRFSLSGLISRFHMLTENGFGLIDTLLRLGG